MATTQKHFMEKFSHQKYLEQVFPYLREKRTRSFVMLSLTLLAIAIFGIFAISPTLATITELQRQLQDAKFAYQQLQNKIQNLSLLGQAYSLMDNDLPIINAALPSAPQATELVGSINALIQENNVALGTIHISPFVLANSQPDKTPLSFFIFSLDVSGTTTNVLAFASSFSHFDRVITIDTLELKQLINNSDLTVTGKAYVMK